MRSGNETSQLPGHKIVLVDRSQDKSGEGLVSTLHQGTEIVDRTFPSGTIQRKKCACGILHNTPLVQCYRRNKYGEKNGKFSPLDFSTTGGMGMTATVEKNPIARPCSGSDVG